MAEVGIERGRQLPVQWTMTLGDLLTLLLCFFVVTLSASSRRAAENSQAHEYLEVQSSSSAAQATEDRGVAVANPGTLLANEVNGVEALGVPGPVLGVTLFPSDFQDGGIAAEAIERLESLLGVGRVHEVSITTCSQAPSQAFAWEESLFRAKAAVERVQAIRPGLMTEVRMVGPECAALRGEQTSTARQVTVVQARQIGMKPHG